MNKYSVSLIVAALAITLVGCNITTDSILVAPTLGIKTPNTLGSEHVQISLLTTQKSSRGGSIITLLVENISNEKIWFPGDMGSVIQEKGSLGINNAPVKDQLGHNYNQEVILPPMGEDVPIWLFSVKPLLESTGEEVTIIIIISGYLYKDGVITNEVVEASVEVTYVP